MSTDYLAPKKQQRFEYSILILLATTGMMMLISAADLIALYLGLELMSLALYVVAAIDRDSVRSTEAGLKYFVLGRLVLGMLLTARRWFTASPVPVTLPASQGGATHSGHLGLVFGLVFLFAGLLLQGLGWCRSKCGRPTSRGRARPRSPPSSPPPEGRRHGHVRAHHHRGVPRRGDPMAADRRVRRHRLDGARRFRGHRPTQHQAADGLFLHRPYGLRAGGLAAGTQDGVQACWSTWRSTSP
jgi:hypothetical protein